MPVRILLVDDHRIVRDGLRTLLTNASSDGVQVREAENGRLAIAVALPRLIAREGEIKQLIAEGQATKQIARLLEISVKTVVTHSRQLMEEMQIFNVPDRTKFAPRARITPPDT